jgi:hypothetical protein
MLMLAFALRRKLGGLQLARISTSLLRILIASVVAGAVGVQSAKLTASLVASALELTAWSKPLPGLVGCVAFSVTFLVGATLLRCEELRVITAPIVRRFGRTNG